MTSREITEPVINERGDESHPAFGLIGASRVSVGSVDGGAVLFDSDLLHSNTVRVRIHQASRKRELHHDWVHGNKEIVEIEMSEAQWASFVSTMNIGDGVPCTIRYLHGERVDEMPHRPRLAETMKETREAAHQTFDKIKQAMATYEATLKDGTAPEKRKALSGLHYTIENAVPNVDFAGKTLIKQTENVVTKARADIEAFVVAKAHQLGINPQELGTSGLPMLEEGGSPDEQ